MSSDTPGDHRILGSLGSANGTGVVRIESRYDTDIDDLWSAFTNPDRLASWHGQLEGDLRPGGEFRLNLESEGWEGTGRIQACEPPRRLLVRTRETDESWRKGHGVPPFDETIDVTLSADGDGTILVIEVQGIPLAPLAFYGAGWQLHVEHLADYFAGRQPGDVETRFDELVPAYQELAASLR